MSNTKTKTFETAINSCNFANSAYLNHHHGHIITGDLRIIANLKLRKIISEGLNYKESRTRSIGNDVRITS